MKNYKYDFNKNCFFIKKDINKIKKYYLTLNNTYVEVNEYVYKVCKNS